MWKEVLDEGVFTQAMVAPAVPLGEALIRLAVQATHTDDHLTRILDAFAAAGRRLGLIASPGSHRATAAVAKTGAV